MKDLSQSELAVAAENLRIRAICRVWLQVEAIHYSKNNSKESAKITLPALQWLLDGLYYLTLEDLMFLYSFLSPTKKTKETSNKDTKISELLSKLSVINSVKISDISLFRNFKSVEPFISMLCSGVFRRPSLKPSNIPEWLGTSGDAGTST